MPWLTPIAFEQGPDDPITMLPRFGDGPRRIRFRHIIHAYHDTLVPSNNAILPLTFQTIERARQFAAPDFPVDCVVVTFPEDAKLVPDDAVRAPSLERDVTNIAEFTLARRLPLLFDVIESGISMALPGAARPRSARLFDLFADRLIRRRRVGTQWSGTADEVEFSVLSNSDIHLQPHFYRVMGTLIREGYDVITANRRTIAVGTQRAGDLPLYLAERGSDHPGLDCFVFPTSMIEHFQPSQCCCGAGHVMRSLLFNLVAQARRLLMLTRAQMTFHLNDDRHWSDPRFAGYLEFNIAQAQSVITRLAVDPEKAERLAEFISAHEMDVYRDALPKSGG